MQVVLLDANRARRTAFTRCCAILLNTIKREVVPAVKTVLFVVARRLLLHKAAPSDDAREFAYGLNQHRDVLKHMENDDTIQRVISQWDAL